MVANAFKVGEQLGVEDTGLVRALAVTHTLQVVAAVVAGHVVDALLQGRDIGQPLHIAGVEREQVVDALQAISRMAEISSWSHAGEGDVALVEHPGVTGQVVGVVADSLDVAGDSKEAADHGGGLLVGFVGD